MHGHRFPISPAASCLCLIQVGWITCETTICFGSV
ncbi:hypothetical protein ERO13_D07G153150v2 [Gossypium hirsutum]|uniref:Uncharacterized protein n=1 Tax=Gossypium darwinii TaxID=34276 RepID=A0A5D2C0I9_GOSDA|nr:hypothetical protein ERO13_D07G153150v2 [Gossypium hirsutum]TYG61783.1 hypothetical protein ES288_D07G176700v1 [Gossypium darwinii]